MFISFSYLSIYGYICIIYTCRNLQPTYINYKVVYKTADKIITCMHAIIMKIYHRQYLIFKSFIMRR